MGLHWRYSDELKAPDAGACAEVDAEGWCAVGQADLEVGGFLWRQEEGDPVELLLLACSASLPDPVRCPALDIWHRLLGPSGRHGHLLVLGADNSRWSNVGSSGASVTLYLLDIQQLRAGRPTGVRGQRNPRTSDTSRQ